MSKVPSRDRIRPVSEFVLEYHDVLQCFCAEPARNILVVQGLPLTAGQSNSYIRRWRAFLRSVQEEQTPRFADYWQGEWTLRIGTELQQDAALHTFERRKRPAPPAIPSGGEDEASIVAAMKKFVDRDGASR